MNVNIAGGLEYLDALMLRPRSLGSQSEARIKRKALSVAMDMLQVCVVPLFTVS